MAAFPIANPLQPGASALSISGIALDVPDDSLRNVWSGQQEADFQARAAKIIAHFASPKRYGNGYGENEKQAYPRAMFDFLNGNRERAIAFLQADDPQSQQPRSIHKELITTTALPSKDKIRKYFLLGQFLDPDYRKRMFGRSQTMDRKRIL